MTQISRGPILFIFGLYWIKYLFTYKTWMWHRVFVLRIKHIQFWNPHWNYNRLPSPVFANFAFKYFLLLFQIAKICFFLWISELQLEKKLLNGKENGKKATAFDDKFNKDSKIFFDIFPNINSQCHIQVLISLKK